MASVDLLSEVTADDHMLLAAWLYRAFTGETWMPTATMTATAQAGDRGRTPPSRESSRSTPPLQLLMLLVRLCGKAVQTWSSEPTAPTLNQCASANAVAAVQRLVSTGASGSRLRAAVLPRQALRII